MAQLVVQFLIRNAQKLSIPLPTSSRVRDQVPYCFNSSHPRVFEIYIYTDMKSHAMIFMRQYHKNQLETVL